MHFTLTQKLQGRVCLGPSEGCSSAFPTLRADMVAWSVSCASPWGSDIPLLSRKTFTPPSSTDPKWLL